MFEIISAILLSLFAVIFAVVGIGTVTGKKRKKEDYRAISERIGELKSYGPNPRMNENAIPEINEAEKKRNWRRGLGGVFEPETGDVKLYERDSETHEGFHRAHYLETMAPTKRMRHKLSKEWDRNKEVIGNIRHELSQLPENLVTDVVREEVDNAFVALSLAHDRDNTLKEINDISDRYKQESKISSYKEYQKYYDADKSLKEFLSKMVYSFLYSDVGAKELEKTREYQLKELGPEAMAPDELRAYVKKFLYSRFVSVTAPWEDKYDFKIAKAFREFVEQRGDDKKFEEKRDAFVDYHNKIISQSRKMDEEYGAYIRTYVDTKKRAYQERNENILRSTGKRQSISMYELPDFRPLTESFAYYLDVLRGDVTQEKAKEILLRRYPQNEEDRRQYGAAFQSIFKLHEGLKTHGDLSDEEVLKIVLPISKYVRSVSELYKFSKDEQEVKGLAEYAKITSKSGRDITDIFGEYRGYTTLKHFKNTRNNNS